VQHDEERGGEVLGELADEGQQRLDASGGSSDDADVEPRGSPGDVR
jgi:hypothetical protein